MTVSPPESRGARKTALVLALLSLAVLGLTPPYAPLVFRMLPVVIAGGCCLLAARRARSVLDLASLVLATTTFVAAGALWQISLALALGLTAGVRRFVPAPGRASFERGKVPVGLTVFAGFITPGALIGWVYFLDPDLSDLTGMIPNSPVGLLVLGGVVFAVANATFEEWVWRGYLQPALSEDFGLAWAVCLQALSFGIAHAHGFPRGAVGVALAGSWAVLLGILRQVSGGLLAPILAHIVADATIASIVIWLAAGD